MKIKSKIRPCKCGCGNSTSGLRKRNTEGEYYYPEYCHGHHKGALGIHHSAWNKGLTKEVCPVLAKMGYQKGHKPFNDWSKVNNRLKTDPEFKEKWHQAKLGIPAWNKGISLKEYPNGIKRGKEHGNFKNGCSAIRNRLFPGYKNFIHSILKRDNFTCQFCNNRKQLNVHHITPVSKDITLILNPDNVITLCHSCHKAIHYSNQEGS